MNISELSQISGYTKEESTSILVNAGYQVKDGFVTGLINVEGKDLTADEYLNAAKKAGVTTNELIVPASSSKALAPTTEKKPAKRGRKAKQSQIEVAAQNFQESNSTLQRQSVEAGVSTGVQLANLYSAGVQQGFLSKTAQNNDQLASVLGGQINRIHQEAEDLIDIEAVYTQLEGNEETPVLTQLFSN